MVRVNSDVTMTSKINNDPIRSIPRVLQADDLRNVGIGSRRLRQSAEKRGNLVIVLDTAETHRRRRGRCFVPDRIEGNLQREFPARAEREARQMAIVEIVLEGTELHVRNRLTES